jgi:hypothetical protein
MNGDKSRRRVLIGAASAVVLTAGIAAAFVLPGSGSPAERQAEVAKKGQVVMPFDLERTTHRFAKTAQGGVQTVVADDPADQTQIRLIRDHLAKELRAFRAGDFGDPASIHGKEMPGLAQLSSGYARIRMTPANLPAGAQITFTTDDAQLTGALHAWFDAQVSDHGDHAEHG